MKYLFEWTSEMSVGKEEIDMQHRQLFNQINILLSAIVNRLEPKTVEDALAFLGQYIDGHLKYEEEYMKQNDYPELESHQVFHKDFIDNYERLKEKKSKGTPDSLLAAEIEQYLGNWLVEHIGHVDQKYAAYLRSK